MKNLNEIINSKVAEIKQQFATPVKIKSPDKLYNGKTIDGLPTDEEIREYIRQTEAGSPGKFSLIDYAKWILDRNENNQKTRT